MSLIEYFEDGIFLACISVFYNLLAMKYFMPTLNQKVYDTGKKALKNDEDLFALMQLLNTNANLSTYGLMFAWVLCWPALLVFKALTIIVWIARKISAASQSEE